MQNAPAVIGTVTFDVIQKFGLRRADEALCKVHTASSARKTVTRLRITGGWSADEALCKVHTASSAVREEASAGFFEPFSADEGLCKVHKALTVVREENSAAISNLPSPSRLCALCTKPHRRSGRRRPRDFRRPSGKSSQPSRRGSVRRRSVGSLRGRRAFGRVLLALGFGFLQSGPDGPAKFHQSSKQALLLARRFKPLGELQAAGKPV